MKFEQSIDKKLNSLKEINRLRQLNSTDNCDFGEIMVDDKKFINLSSNDYLNIASSQSLREEFLSSIDLKKIAFGSTSSRLMTGSCKFYEKVENLLTHLYEKESSLVFSSGYHLNSGIFQSLADKGDVIYSDKLNHASIIDGIRLSNAEHFRFPHLNYLKLEEILSKNKDKYKNTFVVTESVFSMDGDLADLKKLVKLKKKYNFVLIVDEAHGFGVFGKCGKGLCEQLKLENDIDIVIGTFGKATGGMGAFLVCSKPIKNWLVNTARPFIFTTAIPPIQLAWLEFAIKKLITFEDERDQLLKNAETLRELLNENNIETFGDSQIIPIMAGSDKKAVQMAEKMRKNGFFVFPVRPPTVPEGKCRLRISLTTALKIETLKNIPKVLKED